MKKHAGQPSGEKDIKKILDKVNRISLLKEHLKDVNGNLVEIGQIIYFESLDRKTIGFLSGGEGVEFRESVSQLEKRLKGVFLRTHRSFLVCIDCICGASRRYNDGVNEAAEVRDVFDEGTLFVKSGSTRIEVPLTETYSGKVRRVLGLKNLHYLEPEHPDDKKLRLMGLVDFGWRDLYNLDVANEPAKELFTKKWDIKKFSKDRMLANFRQVGSNEIDKRRVIKNVIYQLYRWIKSGVVETKEGNIRSLWYQIKSVLAYHSNIFDANDVDVFYDALQEMVEGYKLFRYKDFGFMDMNEPYRGIGESKPEVILASEKIGHFFFIKRLALKVGASFICLKGEPATISLEYFSDALHDEVKGRALMICCVSDVDPAGYSIESNLVKGLKERGCKIDRVVKLVGPDLFADDEVEILKYPVVKFNQVSNEIEPIAPANMSQVTKARSWYKKELGDTRFMSERKIDGKKQVTIWGVESDAADRTLIEKRFLEEIARKRKKSKG
jgi:hypothetical protein